MSNTPNSFKSVTQTLLDIAASHLMVKQTGVGELSDIDVQTNIKTPTKYPSIFFVPQTSTIDRGGLVVMSYSMIVMDIAKNTQSLEVDALNLTFGITQDIISKISLTSWDSLEINIQTPISTTPFVERFKNNLCGWTSEISIEVKAPLDLCNAAFA
jgi:hypothetical protein